jgi:uncharacterized protein (TIGR01777 family)
MKVVVAGGSGLVGRHLTRSLGADGHEVVVLSRDAVKAGRRLPAGARAVDWAPSKPDDRDRLDALAATIAGTDAVVSLAGAPVGPWRWTKRRKATIENSRILGIRTLVSAIGQLPAGQRPHALVVVSGVDAYPETSETDTDPTSWTEASPIGDGFLADVSRVLEAEAASAESLGVRVACLRQGHVLAPDAQLVRLLALPVRLFVGGRMGSGRQWYSWVHIDDVVGLFRLAIDDPRVDGVLNVVAPGAVRQIDFVRAIGAALHRPTRFPVPAWLIRLALGETSALLLGSRRAAPARALELGYMFHHTDVREAFRDVLR